MRVLNYHHGPHSYHAMSGMPQLLKKKKKRIPPTDSTSFYCFISLCHSESCMLTKDCVLSSMSNGDYCTYLSKGWGNHTQICVSKILFWQASRKKEDGRGRKGGRETN